MKPKDPIFSYIHISKEFRNTLICLKVTKNVGWGSQMDGFWKESVFSARMDLTAEYYAIP